LRKSGQIYVHSEQVLAAEAKSEGLTQSRVATSNNACTAQCMSNLRENYPDVVHVNPNRTFLHEHPEHEITPRQPPAAKQPPPIPDKARKPVQPGKEGSGTGEGGTATEPANEARNLAPGSEGAPAGGEGGTRPEGGKAAAPAGGGGRTIVEYVGDPTAPVNEGSLNSSHALVEGLLVMLQAKEFENLQQAEVQKYEDKLRDLMPQIETLRNEDKDVGITLIVERPDSFNLTHGVVPEYADLIRFIDLRIDDNPWWASADPNYNARAREEARGGTLEQQLNAQLGNPFPKDKRAPEGWHYESATEVVPSYRKLASRKGFDGTYRPVAVIGASQGKLEAAKSVGLTRVLSITHQNQYAYTVEMREGIAQAAPPSSGYAGVHDSPQEPTGSRSDPSVYRLQVGVGSIMVPQGDQNKFGGVFIKGTPGQAGSYKLDSQMLHIRDKGKDIIIEIVTGEDLDPQWKFSDLRKWNAVIRWEKL
jgi:hypothetical protein